MSYWTALAPGVEDYNSVVGKAIAAGFGQIIKGIFLCSNAYASQVQKGGAFIHIIKGEIHIIWIHIGKVPVIIEPRPH